MMTYIYYIGAALILFCVLRFILKLKFKLIIKFLINILIGGLVLYFINYIPGININMDVFKSLTVGFLGIPGAIIVIIYYFLVEK